MRQSFPHGVRKNWISKNGKHNKELVVSHQQKTKTRS